MKFATVFAALLMAAFAVAGCKKDADPATGLAGVWKLTSRTECYCPIGPAPNETLTLTDTYFSFTRDGKVVRQGTYVQNAAAKCGTTTPVPVLALTEAASQTISNVPFTLRNDELVLDYRNNCISDSPLDTYQRLQ